MRTAVWTQLLFTAVSVGFTIDAYRSRSVKRTWFFVATSIVLAGTTVIATVSN
jgi:hypothetical protein